MATADSLLNSASSPFDFASAANTSIGCGVLPPLRGAGPVSTVRTPFFTVYLKASSHHTQRPLVESKSGAAWLPSESTRRSFL